MSLLIKNGRLIDPLAKKDGLFDILCSDGKISKIGRGISSRGRVIDAKGLVVSPGFIDLHSHLREPGYEHKETIRSGTESAAAGGFTTIVCMANTLPVNDNAVITKFIQEKGRAGVGNLLVVGAISRGLEGKTLADIGQMAEAGIVGISDDGRCVMDSALMRKAMQYARGFNLLVISHAEDENLSSTGSVNEGIVATELGLPGSPNAAEEIIVARDIALAELTRARLHIAHLTTRVGLELVRAAKKRGVAVSCEATPHHLTLTDKEVEGYNTHAFVRPPLRSSLDVKALRKGLKEGIIDAIATDHAPHASWEKEVEFVKAAPGVIGFETALPVTLKLVEEKVIRLADLIRLLSAGPAGILRLENKGTLRPGSDADITIFDPEKKITIDPSKFKSKSRNTPFQGWDLKGKVRFTIVNGKVVYSG